MKKSPLQDNLDKGTAKVGSKERKLVKGARKTKEGKEKHLETEDQRVKEEKLIKATLK